MTRATPAARPAPFVGFDLQLLASGARDGVVARLAIVLGDLPIGSDPALARHPVQRGIQRSLLHAERFAGEVLDAFADSPPVLGIVREHLEDQHVEGAANDVAGGAAHEIGVSSRLPSSSRTTPSPEGFNWVRGTGDLWYGIASVFGMRRVDLLSAA